MKVFVRSGRRRHVSRTDVSRTDGMQLQFVAIGENLWVLTYPGGGGFFKGARNRVLRPEPFFIIIFSHFSSS